MPTEFMREMRKPMVSSMAEHYARTKMTDDKHIELIKEPLLSAFPNGNLFPGNRGLTMRDHFAGLAMQAMLSSTHVMPGPDTTNNMARQAYHFADAMMAQREK